jgi:hypothetical protein
MQIELLKGSQTIPYVVDPITLTLDKVPATYNEPLLGIERTALLRHGTYVSCRILNPHQPQDAHEISFIYVLRDDRVINLLIPKGYQVASFVKLKLAIRQRLEAAATAKGG